MLNTENIKSLSAERRAAIQERAKQALVRYQSGQDHNAAYDILRYARAGILCVKDNIFD